jgi:CO/xanthine dehydrogenase Mo-binding subunit
MITDRYLFFFFFLWVLISVFVETVFMMETMMEHVASVLGMAPDLVREVNMYKKGDTTLAGQYLEFCNVKEVLDSIKVHDT